PAELLRPVPRDGDGAAAGRHLIADKDIDKPKMRTAARTCACNRSREAAQVVRANSTNLC
ncbi:MAG: hypothetical protein JXQ99_00345, partial [Hyphomicrobiaceae bacterium]